MMKTKVILMIPALCCLAAMATSNEWCHRIIPRINPFDVTRSYLNITTPALTKADLNLFVEKILHRVKCDVLGSTMNFTCQSCLNADHIYNITGLLNTARIDDVNFHKASTIILAFIIDVPGMCTNPPDWDTVNFGYFIDKLMQFDLHSQENGSSPKIYFEINQLEDVNTILKRRYRPGPVGTDNPNICADDHQPMMQARDVWMNTNPANLTLGLLKSELPVMSAQVLVRILQGYCVYSDAFAKYKLPDELDFISAIFKTYGSATCELKKKGVGELFTKLKESGHHDDHDDDHEDDHDDHADHHDDHEGSESHFLPNVTEKCLSTTQLFKTFGLKDATGGISRETFRRMCPALVQQGLQGCHHPVTVAKPPGPTVAQKYGFSVLAALIISATALPALALGKVRGHSAYFYALALMLGLAMGTLLGDSILHLIPHGLGLHGHDHGDQHAADEPIEVDPSVWKLLAACGSVWLFFVIQMILSSVSRGEQIIENRRKKPSEHVYDNGLAVADGEKGASNVDMTTSDATIVPSLSSDAVSLQVEATTPASIAWMICIGDSIHNFADGLAIGASFAADWRTGVSTTIAIFCHEIPQEFGDMSVLLAAGWSIKKAALLQFMTAFLCVVGVFVGVPIAEDEGTRNWIFVVISGLFLYISLCDVAPEILEIYRNNKSKVKVFFAAHGGFLLGLSIMVVIAIFEDRIQV